MIIVKRFCEVNTIENTVREVDMSEDIMDQVHRDILNLMIEQGYRTVEDLSLCSREYPFIYKGMSIEEYWIERVYYSKHLKELVNGTYRPLWQQRQDELQKKFISSVATVDCEKEFIVSSLTLMDTDELRSKVIEFIDKNPNISKKELQTVMAFFSVGKEIDHSLLKSVNDNIDPEKSECEDNDG